MFAALGLMFSRYVAFPAVSAAAGALVGALFPVCSNLVPDESGGKVYACDLAGASGGALVAGLVLIPSLGLHSAALLTAFAGLFLAFPMLAAIIAGKVTVQGGS
jgi:predicted membrane-bound spermidine synthase